MKHYYNKNCLHEILKETLNSNKVLSKRTFIVLLNFIVYLRK